MAGQTSEARKELKADLDILSIVLLLFGVIELANVILLYIAPGSRRGNSIGILITGNAATKVFTASALIFSIMTFFSRMYPALKKMDEKGQITPRGYSRTLAIMIAVFIAVFAAAVIVYLVNYRKVLRIQGVNREGECREKGCIPPAVPGIVGAVEGKRPEAVEAGQRRAYA